MNRQPYAAAAKASAQMTANAMSDSLRRQNWASAKIVMHSAPAPIGKNVSSSGKPEPVVWPVVNRPSAMAYHATDAAAVRTTNAAMASTRRRACGPSFCTKKATPAFSLRASALAAPKKAIATISPRATSSAHSIGAAST